MRAALDLLLTILVYTTLCSTPPPPSIACPRTADSLPKEPKESKEPKGVQGISGFPTVPRSRNTQQSSWICG
ncbi:hypothetical protein BZA77DRAFT_300867 [Pyronema omphalodes]|nr:hypothetical protein BZA77DRAFT_300867 [Pyronema omphalodes]